MVCGKDARPVRTGAVGLGLLALVALLVVPSTLSADDVPDEVRVAYDLGRKLLAKGDRASLEKAYKALDARKGEALDSVDYWEAYVRIWRALKKEEGLLWNGVVARFQKAQPKSPVFDLVRARLETEDEKRLAHIESALKRSPKSLRARVAKAIVLLDMNDEDEADVLLDEALEDSPYDAGALAGKARLALSDGMPAEAIEFLDKALEKHSSADLYHTKALCYMRLAKVEEDGLSHALEAAAQAVGLDATPEHVKTFNDLLTKTGDAATAAKALKEHFERTRMPLLGRLLAESAFRAGDYEAAVLGLSAARDNDPQRLKGLTVAYARLGKAGLARQAARKVLSVDSRGVLFAARIEMLLGDAAGVKKRLGSLADADALRLRIEALAWEGDEAGLMKLAGKRAADGSRSGEDALAALLQARVMGRMGEAHAKAVRKKLLEARRKVGAGPLAQASFAGGSLGKVKTTGWALRAVTYWLTPCGRPWRPTSEDGNFGRTVFMDGGGNFPSVCESVSATSDCPDHKQGSFHFNKKKSSSPQGMIELFGTQSKLGEFKPAQAAFTEGCAACVAKKTEEAADAMLRTLNAEPGWHRARVFRLLVLALGPDGEKRDAAREAAKVAEAWPGDLVLRRLVVFLRAWAGDAELVKEIEALATYEAMYNERDLAAL